jgi:hypothetical protein
MPGWGKVAIGVRVTHPEPRFFQSWTRLVTRGLRPGDVVLTPVVDLPHHYAADAVALHFLRSDADSVLYVDDDMTFTTDALSRLRDFQPGHQFDVLQAVALSRNGPHFPVVLFKNAEQYEVMPRPPAHTVIPVALCGLAFTLIRRATFERIAAKKDPKDFFFYWGRRGDSEDAGFRLTPRLAAACSGYARTFLSGTS